MEFKDRLRTAMANNKVNARELSRKSGISESSISRYLLGQMEPKPDKVKLLAKALHVSEVYLLNIEEQTDPIPDLLYEFGIDPHKKVYIHQYVTMSPENQKQVEKYISFLLSQQDDDSSEADK